MSVPVLYIAESLLHRARTPLTGLSLCIPRTFFYCVFFFFLVELHTDAKLVFLAFLVLMFVFFERRVNGCGFITHKRSNFRRKHRGFYAPDTRLARANTHSISRAARRYPLATFCHVPSLSHGSREGSCARRATLPDLHKNAESVRFPHSRFTVKKNNTLSHRCLPLRARALGVFLRDDAP